MKWTRVVCFLALAFTAVWQSGGLVAQESSASFRAEGEAAFAEGRYEKAYGLLEQALVEDLANGDRAAVAAGLGALGKVLESQGRLQEAASYFRSSLVVWMELEDRSGMARALRNIGRIYELRGDLIKAEDHFEKARLVLAGTLTTVGLVATADPLACGASKEITPDPKKLPGGSWSAWGIGNSESAALKNALQQAFTGMYGLPTCKDTCPDGTPPTTGQCVADINSSDPPSTKPADYGSPPWKVYKKKNGRVVIGPVTITKFPAGLTAIQSCSACC